MQQLLRDFSKSQRKTHGTAEVVRIHPLGTMGIFIDFHGNLSNRFQDISQSPKQWTHAGGTTAKVGISGLMPWRT